MTDAILVLNVGSSSIKFALYGMAASAADLLLEGKLASAGQAQRLQARWAASGRAMQRRLKAGADNDAGLAAVLNLLRDEAADFRVVAAGHRIVHGGPAYAEPVRITAAVLDGIARFNPAAPYHNAHNLAGVQAVQRHYPDLPQVACFDTGFHRTQPLAERLFALPRRFAGLGITRYGFHGLSYEFIASELARHEPSAAQGRTLVAHLGNGASMCAVKNGRSIATTMGFTTLDGLVMGRRCGALDPGVVLYLVRELGHGAADVEEMLYRESGLLGVSGISDDMRELLASDALGAKEAIDLYCHRALREAGALIALLGGIDCLVFTGGVGENAAPVRDRIVAGLGWLGLRLSADANEANASSISAPDSAARVRVMPTNEERVIAGHTAALLAAT